jgi:hypothetical protein
VQEQQTHSTGAEASRSESHETSDSGPNKSSPNSSRQNFKGNNAENSRSTQGVAEEAANRAQQAAAQAHQHVTQAARRTSDFVRAVAGEIFNQKQSGQESQAAGEKAGSMLSDCHCNLVKLLSWGVNLVRCQV